MCCAQGGAPPACASPSPCSPACRTSRRTRARRWGKPSPCLPYRHSYKYTSIGFVWFCFYACIKPSVDRPKNNVFQWFWFFSWILLSWIESSCNETPYGTSQSRMRQLGEHRIVQASNICWANSQRFLKTIYILTQHWLGLHWVSFLIELNRRGVWRHADWLNRESHSTSTHWTISEISITSNKTGEPNHLWHH